jgi:hypothetical protein
MRASVLLAGLTSAVALLTAANVGAWEATPLAGTAQASPSVSEQMLAQSLFDEGRQLMDRGAYAEACPKLAESQRLDPGGGTLLNLAICHEKEGRLGTAYLEMKAASSQASKDGRKDREKIANEHLATLGLRVPHLAVHVVQEEPNLEVTVDGTPLRKPAWDLLTVVDPGAHVIDASAPGKAPSHQTITLAEAEQRTVTIPALVAGEGRSLPPPAVAGIPTSDPAKVAPEKKTNPWFVASAATGVTGFVVGVPAAYVWGMMKLLESTCDPTRVGGGSSSFFCTSDAVRDRWLAAAVIGLSVGVVGTIGLVAFPSKIQIAPSATANGGSAAVVAHF